MRAIVLASDGLWDAMKYEDVCEIVRAPALLGNAEAACTALMAAAQVANSMLFGYSADNITVVVVYLTSPPEEEPCTADLREGICRCCGTCTVFRD